jgi:hypothetical protein
MGHKNDYSVVVFFPNEKPKKWAYVHRLDGFAEFLNKKHSGWLYMNVYDRMTKVHMKRFYNGHLVPDFL